MTTLTREDRLALERACENRSAHLRDRRSLEDYWSRKDLDDERARLENLRRLLAAGEHLVLP